MRNFGVRRFSAVRIALIILMNAFKSNPNTLSRIIFNSKFVGDGIISSNSNLTLRIESQKSGLESSMNSLPNRICEYYEGLEYRNHIFSWAFNRALNLEGQLMALGVFWGVLEYSAIVNSSFCDSNKIFYLVDPWGSIALASKTQNAGTYSEDIFEKISHRFANFKNIKLIRDVAPYCLNQIEIEKLAFLSIDMNGDEAEIQSLELLFPKFQKGTIIYLDDLGCNYPILEMKILEFCDKKNLNLLYFPTGQGIIII